MSRDDAQIEVKRAGAAQKTPEKVSIFTLLLGDDGHPTARVLATEEIVPPGRAVAVAHRRGVQGVAMATSHHLI